MDYNLFDMTDAGRLMQNYTDDDRASYWWFSKLFNHKDFYVWCKKFEGLTLNPENY